MRAAPARADGRVPSPTTRLPALDGLRGVAVLAVIAFHLDFAGFLDAGFLGVDVFFTISGFLITALLLREQARTGRIAWRAFLVRRMHRLFPAAAAMVTVTAAVTITWYPDAAARTVADLPAAWTFASNWWQLASQQSYFEAQGRPPVLQHMWSLAIEEQFYLLWPLVLVALARVGHARAALPVALLLASASAGWMALLFLEHGDAASRNRLYLGTDTHAAGLLIGAALGCLAGPWRLLEPHRRPLGAGVACDLAASGAVAALVWMAMTWHEATPQLYLGGFAAVGLCTALVILAATDTLSPVGWILRNPLLRWAGTRSYSLYLWHWPAFVWLRHPAGEAQRSPAATLTVLALVAIAGELSFRLLERTSGPAAHGCFRFAASRAGWLFAAAVAMLVVQSDDVARVVPEPLPALATAEPAAVVVVASEAVPAPLVQEVVAVPASQAATRVREPMTVIGDSVMLGAKPYLAPMLGAEVDAVVGRQFSEGLAVLRKLRGTAALSPVVVVHLGTNGYISEPHASELVRSLRDRELVLVVDVHAHRRWTAPNNAILERVVAQVPNARLVRWTALARDHPEFFVSDGIHLTRAGMVAMTREIARAAGVAPATFAVAPRPSSPNGRMLRTGGASAPAASVPMPSPVADELAAPHEGEEML